KPYIIVLAILQRFKQEAAVRVAVDSIFPLVVPTGEVIYALNGISPEVLLVMLVGISASFIPGFWPACTSG
ncbi:MAG: hypothetical protein AB2693_25180, partial [Candidatus Thiodiazotropha sp.]